MRFFAANVGKLMQEDVEVMFAFVVCGRGVACSTPEDVSQAAGDVIEFLFLI